MSGLGPGDLARTLAGLEVEIEAVDVETGPVEVTGYYGGAPRPKGVVHLTGGGATGRGECVAWTAAEQAGFAAACPRLVPLGRTTVGALEARLGERSDDPYHRAAVEGAAIDLALAQSSTTVFALAGRDARPVTFCRSINETDDPGAAVRGVLAADPSARVKIDCPEAGWDAADWEALAATGRIATVDLKRRGPPGRPAEAHRWLPGAWIEDPPVEAAAGLGDGGSPAWAGRIALDGYVERAADLDRPPLPPVAVNVKAPRVGGWLEALRCLEACRRRGWRAYVGGMFEVDVGRDQATVLASLYTSAAWNDLAPLTDPGRGSPLEPPGDHAGFAPPRETPPGLSP